MKTELIYRTFSYSGDALKGVQLALDVSLDERVLDVDTMTVTVQTTAELDAFQQDAAVALLRGGSQYALWYIKSVTRVADDLYRLTLMSSLGRLAQLPHKGGIYNGVAAGVILDDIFGDIPHAVAAVFASTLLYGYLPYVSPSGENGAPTGSAKDNLLKVLFALNATVRADADGTLRVDNLGTATQAIITDDSVYRDGATVRTEPPVTSVTVLEHQYIAGDESVTLFSGTAEAGKIVIFREPVSGLSWHTDTDPPVEMPIAESGANYAILGAGTGTLTGLRYIHTTREVTEPVTTEARALIGRQARYYPSGPSVLFAHAGVPLLVDCGADGVWSFELSTVVLPSGSASIRISYLTLNVGGSSLDASRFDLRVTSGPTAGQYFHGPVYPASGGGAAADTTLRLRTETPIYGTQPVAVENPVRVEDATLVGITNSSDVVERLAEYYRHRQWIECDAVIERLRAGDVASLYDPFRKTQTLACVEKLSPVTVSQVLKARVSALIGYSPWQVAPFEDVRELLTGSGTFTVPAGVTSLEIVLIGGGRGAGAGNNGEPAPVPSTVSYSNRYWAEGGYYTARQIGFSWDQAVGGDGGEPGVPGDGGAIFVARLAVSAGDTFAYSCGAGGAGSPRGTLEQGALGGDTVFGAYTSADGAPSSYGYLDPVTGTVYAARGGSGIAGGKGSGMLDADTPYHADPIVVDGVSYVAGADNESSVDRSVGRYDRFNGSFEAHVQRGGFGGGPAYKSDGDSGYSGSAALHAGDEYSTGYARVYPGRGGDGGDALASPAASGYGTGGTGGNGGGGNGAYGWPSWAENNVKEGLSGGEISCIFPEQTSVGLGSDGGKGAPGCVLVYYRRPIPES